MFTFCSYASHIKKLSEIIKDEQIKPMERAVWNVEHLIKFPNALHYKYYGREISYLRYYGTIVIVITLIAIIIWSTLFLPAALCYFVINKRTVKKRIK